MSSWHETHKTTFILWGRFWGGGGCHLRSSSENYMPVGTLIWLPARLKRWHKPAHQHLRMVKLALHFKVEPTVLQLAVFKSSKRAGASRAPASLPWTSLYSPHSSRGFWGSLTMMWLVVPVGLVTTLKLEPIKFTLVAQYADDDLLFLQTRLYFSEGHRTLNRSGNFLSAAWSCIH